MQLIKPTPQPSLEQAMALLNQSAELVWRYLDACECELSARELSKFQQFHETLWETHTASEAILRGLKQRHSAEIFDSTQNTDGGECIAQHEDLQLQHCLS